MVMKADKTGILSTFTKRPQLGLRKTNHPKAIKKHKLVGKIVRSKLEDGSVELTVKSKIKGIDHVFYVKFPEAILNNTNVNEKIPKDLLLNQVEVRLDNPNKFITLNALTRDLNKTSLDNRSKAILALVVENVVDQYRGATTLKKLHNPQT